MAIWRIEYENDNWAGNVNSGETVDEALEKFHAEKARPHYQIRYHEELLQTGRCDNFQVGRGLKEDRTGMGNVLRCDYYPNFMKATKAIKMREIWIDAGYALVPA